MKINLSFPKILKLYNNIYLIKYLRGGSEIRATLNVSFSSGNKNIVKIIETSGEEEKMHTVAI